MIEQRHGPKGAPVSPIGFLAAVFPLFVKQNPVHEKENHTKEQEELL